MSKEMINELMTGLGFSLAAVGLLRDGSWAGWFCIPGAAFNLVLFFIRLAFMLAK